LENPEKKVLVSTETLSRMTVFNCDNKSASPIQHITIISEGLSNTT